MTPLTPSDQTMRAAQGKATSAKITPPPFLHPMREPGEAYIHTQARILFAWKHAKASRQPQAALDAIAASLSWNAGNAGLVLDRDCHIHTIDFNELLREACRLDLDHAIEPLIAAGADPLRPSGLRSAMTHAAAHGALRAIAKLAALGVDANAASGAAHLGDASENSRHETPMIAAAHGGHIKAMESLLLLGASLDKADGGGRAPMQWAAQMDRAEAIEWLIARGASAVHADNLGTTALIEASFRGHKNSMRALCRLAPESLEMPDLQGRRPLHYACLRRTGVDAMLILADHGADFSVRDRERLTPAALARREGNAEMAQAAQAVSESHALGAACAPTAESAEPGARGPRL